MSKHLSTLLAFLLLPAGLCLADEIATNKVAAYKPVEPEPYYKTTAILLSEKLPALHITHMPFGDTVSERAFDKYLSSLDPYHLYFLQSDIDEFSQKRDLLDDMVSTGNVQFAYNVFNTLYQRVSNRVDYTASLFDKGFDLEKDEDYAWKRRDASPASSKEEWNDLWRKHIKNQYIQKLIASKDDKDDTKDKDEAKPDEEKKESAGKSIIDSYERYRDILGESEPQWVLERYLTSFTTAYDPHCSYMSPAKVDDFDIDMKLSLVGIGAVLRTDGDSTLVVKILPGGPAGRDKRDTRLRADDRIIAVAQGDEPSVDIRHWSINKVVRLIRGKKGTKVVLTVIDSLDPTGETIKKVDIIRDNVKLEQRAAKYEIKKVTDGDGVERKIGVLNLPAFYGDMKAAFQKKEDYRSSTRDVAKILLEMEQKGVDGIILDLRGNGGGALREAIEMSGLFIEWGPVVTVNNRPLGDRDPSLATAKPLVILITRYSASASEILAGALQDYGRALVVGDSKTLGKGTVQTIVRLSDDSRNGSLKVTTAMYFRITGSSTQLKGVTADVVLPSPFDMRDIGEDYLDYALEWKLGPRCRFAPFNDLVEVVPDLNEWSIERRQTNEAFVAYTNLLAQVKLLNDRESIPLKLEKRYTLAAERKRLNDLQKKILSTEDEDNEDDKDNNDQDKKIRDDLILSEALNITADLIAVYPKPHFRKASLKMIPEIIHGRDLPKDIQEEVADLVKKLGSPKADERVEAKKKLAEMGRIAIPLLRELRDSADPEVRQSIIDLLGDD